MLVKLTETRVWRPFLGGGLLDTWMGRPDAADGHYPERWLGSTVDAGGGAGLSRTAEGVHLRDILGRELPILAKLLDSATRLMLQTHPSDEQARRYFGQPRGKPECWYILDTREMDGVAPYVYLGFRAGITRAKWEDVFHRQDIDAMCALLNRVDVRPGQCYYIPPNVPHAMGSGVFFAEIQQAADLTLRTERVSPAGETLPDEMLHMGAGFEVLFDCFAYTPSLPANYLVPPDGERILDNPRFHLRHLRTAGAYTVPDFAILLALSGGGTLEGRPLEPGDEYYITEGFTVSANADVLVFTGAADIMKKQEGITC